MSTQEANIPTLLKDVESFMDSRMDHRHMKYISDALNTLSEVPLKVKHKIFENLAHSDSKRIMRCLDLFEYLTHHSPSKLLEIIKEPKFIEVFPYTMSEDELKEVGLNILKVWSEKFQGQREQLSALFDFIGNLDMFDIYLPSVYKPRFEEEIPTVLASNYIEPANISVDALLERAKGIRKETKGLLDDQDSEDLPAIYLKPILEALLGEYKNLLSDVLKLGLSEPNGKASYQLTNILSELDEYEIRLNKKLEDLDKDNADSDSQKTSDIDTMLTLEEFNSYKIHPCKDGTKCPHSEAEIGYTSIEFNSATPCPFWHSGRDKRRPPMNEAGDIVYGFHLCDQYQLLEYCEAGDGCSDCHNDFERYFHPHFYKTNECLYEMDRCDTGKYCPDYHTPIEQKAWKEILKKNFKPKPRKSSTELLYDQLNDNTSAKARSGNASRGSLNDFNLDPMPAGMEAHLSIPYGMINYGNIGTGELGYNDSAKMDMNRNTGTHAIDEKRTQELNGHLHAKLVIKRDYHSPQLYTKFFKQNPCFNGVPLTTDPSSFGHNTGH